MTTTHAENLIEPRIAQILNRKQRIRSLGVYIPKNAAGIEKSLTRFFTSEGLQDVQVSKVNRMSGGASKEQFSFYLQHAGQATPQGMVLRMDPYESIAETCRLREFEIIRAVSEILPVPPVVAVDAEGDILGRPGMITRFVDGVTKPSTMEGISVSGIGSSYGDFADKLAPQFVSGMAAIHSIDPSKLSGIDNFLIPANNTKEAALYQVGWWSTVWEIDKVEPIPLMTWIMGWLRENVPVCEKVCLVHSDFRIGNFMFEEPSGKFTAILDWELAHFGDYHEDIAWVLQKLFGSWASNGEFLVCGLMPRAEFIKAYEDAVGHPIDIQRIHYYEVLNAWKCAVMDLSTAIKTGINGTNHQDLLVTWLGSAGAVFLSQIVNLIEEGYKSAA